MGCITQIVNLYLRISSFWSDYSDAYILVRGTLTIAGQRADNAAKQAQESNKGVIF